MIMVALLVVAQLAVAGPAEVKPEMNRERATKILESKDTVKKEKYISALSDAAAEVAAARGNSLSIKKALLQGDADLLRLVFNAKEKRNAEMLSFIGDASAGVKTTKEASALAKIDEMNYTGNFKTELTKAVENGKSLEEAIKAASKAIGKTGKDEITLEKILDCLA